MRLVLELTNSEGYVLARIERDAPVTAYELRMSFAGSPVAALSSSAGTIYPIVRRLRARDFITAEAIDGDRRGTERLSCTVQGKAVLKQWLKSFSDADLLLEDPLRTRFMFMSGLARQERIAWLRSVRAALRNKAQELEDYCGELVDPFEQLAFDNARATSEARLAWVERAIERLTGS